MSDGAYVWTIPDAYMPKRGPEGEYVGHESLCVLNTGGSLVTLLVGFYFADRPPHLGVKLSVPAERCIHFRFDKPEQLGGYVVPREVPYGLRVQSDLPVVVQHSRLDVTQPNMAFLSTMGHAH
jgi:hypothetical protein